MGRLTDQGLQEIRDLVIYDAPEIPISALQETLTELDALRAELQRTEAVKHYVVKCQPECEEARARLTRELAGTAERANREAQLACDLRSTQDVIIERCAKAVEDKWPEAAARLMRHCGAPEDANVAVSGEDFGQLRRELAEARAELARLLNCPDPEVKE